jgi:hypothetical protein
VVKTVGDLQLSVKGGSLKSFDKTITSDKNVLRRSGVIQSITGVPSHKGGGSGFAALFNGSAGNGNGGWGTADDGQTFVGMDEGSTLDIVFDPGRYPQGFTISVLRSYAGHADGRASQSYTVFAATKAAPEKLIRIADVNFEVNGELNEVTVASIKGEPLIKEAVRLRFVFNKGPAGFNVYREIALFE